jgi:phosphoserine phosphatase RsbU/P
VIFTDGLVEAMNALGEEYGQQRVLNVLHARMSATPTEMLRRIMSDLDAFVGDTAQHDDVTCMIMKAA